MSTDRFRLLFVCTANQVRSPIAEVLAAAAISQARLPWSITSAGTRAVDGKPMHPLAIAALTELGHPSVPGWTSTRLRPDVSRAADLILTADIVNRGRVVLADPAALRRTFTLRQFADLVTAGVGVDRGDPDDAAARLLAAAHRARAQIQPFPHGAQDIADPIAGGASKFRAAAAQIDAALRVILDATGISR